MLRPSYLFPTPLAMALVLFSLPARAMPAWDADDAPATPARTTPTTAEPDWEAGDSASTEAPLVESGSDASAPPVTAAPNSESELDARLQVLDEYLADMQPAVRRHYFGWIAAHAGIVGVSAYLASASEGVERTASIVRASTSSANLLLMLLTPQPGRYASKRYRSLPADSAEEKRAKLAAGEKWLAAQARIDKLATSPLRHILGAVVAVGAGAALVIAHEDGLREGLTMTIGILLVSELTIATRSSKPRLYNQSYAAAPSGPVQLSVAPWVTQSAQGFGVVGQF